MAHVQNLQTCGVLFLFGFLLFFVFKNITMYDRGVQIENFIDYGDITGGGQKFGFFDYVIYERNQGSHYDFSKKKHISGYLYVF